MVEIKRLIALKKQSEKIISSVEKLNSIQILAKDYVSKTGLTKSDIAEKIDKIKSCCSIVELNAEYKKNDEGSHDQILSVSNGNFCKQHTVCPVCADRSQSRRRARFNEPIKQQAALVKEGKRYAYIVTYTIKDGKHLSERLEALKEARMRWRKMGQKRKDNFSGGESRKIKAGLSTIEIKRGKNSDLWHVHAHELLFTDEKLDYQIYDPILKKELHKKYGLNIPKEKLISAAIETVSFNDDIVPVSKVSKEWLRCTDGESISIDVSPMSHVPKNVSMKKKRKLASMTFEQSIAYQAKEVIKYMSKLNENSASDVLEIITDTYNKRMVSTYGEFRSVPGDDYRTEEFQEKEKYVIVWDGKNSDYKNPQPGNYTDFKDEEYETRKKVAILLGEYRRNRRYILESNIKDMAVYLDNLKASFKETVSKTWLFFRNKCKREQSSNECDRYNSLLSLNGYFIEASSHDIYLTAFQ